MLELIYEDVAIALKKIRNITLYLEDVPQGFRSPCFMVTIYDQNPSRGINGRMKNSVYLDVHYFPLNESGTESYEECWAVSEDLALLFDLNRFKIRDRNFKITDNVLHFQFRIDYREFINTHEVKMQEMEQNTGLKGE